MGVYLKDERETFYEDSGFSTNYAEYNFFDLIATQFEQKLIFAILGKILFHFFKFYHGKRQVKKVLLNMSLPSNLRLIKNEKDNSWTQITYRIKNAPPT